MALNPDPAVFEAAFVLDDSEEPSRAGTPKPVPPEKDVKDTDSNPQNGISHKTQDGKEEGAMEKKSGSQDGSPSQPRVTELAPTPAASELSPEVRQKLRKLEKLEATYPGEIYYTTVSTDKL